MRRDAINGLRTGDPAPAMGVDLEAPRHMEEIAGGVVNFNGV